MNTGAWLESRAAPYACGAATMLLVAVTWGSFRAAPLMHDEWAYWTQAQQYAALQWSTAAPPIPEFFEQLYVFVSPTFAVKYWPGHAMAIAAGFALGVPTLMPILFSGVAGALVFALARRAADARVAMLTFVFWVSSFGNLRFRAGYFSELTTSAAWLAAWWALLEWRETRRTRWMVLLALFTGWGAITRPATMFVFAIPVGVIVLMDTWRQSRWKQLVIGLACGTAVLAILPLWSARTTGDWRTTPLGAYTSAYMPFDIPGYSLNDTPPERALPPEMERVRGFLRDAKVDQATVPVWKTFAARAGFLLRDAFAGWRLPLFLAFAVGLVVAGPAGWFAIGTSVLLVVGYLTQAHTPDWTIYYLEAFPPVAFIAALGVMAIARRVRERAGVAADAPAVRAMLPASLVAAVFLVATDTIAARGILARVGMHTRDFRAGVAALPATPNIVFVRYAEQRNIHLALVANDGDLARAPSWIVHDRGADDVRLISLAPDRKPYLYDEASGTFLEITP